LAFKQLQQAAEPAINILNGINKTVSMSSFRGDLTLAIYELGVCFRHGWGIPKSKATAAHYFEIAANMVSFNLEIKI
jgi:TPR repeat protein